MNEQNGFSMFIEQVNRFLRSTKLAIVLIIIIAVLCILASFVPQNRPEAFYTETYAFWLSTVILCLGFDTFFSSLIFYIPLSIFSLNLIVCTIGRILKHKKFTVWRIGPDIIHLSILIIITGALMLSLTSQEGYADLETGESLSLPDGYRLSIQALEQSFYPDGRPEDWLTHVRVEGRGIDREETIEVNHPLHLGEVWIYQYSFTEEGMVFLENKRGDTAVLTVGERLRTEDGYIHLKSIEARLEISGEARVKAIDPAAVFLSFPGTKASEMQVLKRKAGSSIDSIRLKKIEVDYTSILRFSMSRGNTVLLIGFLLLVASLSFTFFNKIREKTR